MHGRRYGATHLPLGGQWAARQFSEQVKGRAELVFNFRNIAITRIDWAVSEIGALRIGRRHQIDTKEISHHRRFIWRVVIAIPSIRVVYPWPQRKPRVEFPWRFWTLTRVVCSAIALVSVQKTSRCCPSASPMLSTDGRCHLCVDKRNDLRTLRAEDLSDAHRNHGKGFLGEKWVYTVHLCKWSQRRS